MDKIQKTKQFDLAERTFQFARNVALYVRTLPRTISNSEYGKQIVRSSGSVRSNYIEANEALSKKGFIMRIKICRNQGKESAHWLRLIVKQILRNLGKKARNFSIKHGVKKNILFYPFKITIVYFIAIVRFICCL